MGCAGGKLTPLPAVDGFLAPHGRSPKYLNSSLASDRTLRLSLPSAAIRAYEECTVSEEGGPGFVKLLPNQATMQICVNDMADKPVALLELKERRSFVAYNEDYDRSALHFYIYAYAPRVDKQGRSSQTGSGQPLFNWARVTVESPGGFMCNGADKAPTFTMHMASGTKKRQHTCELFEKELDQEAYESRSHSGGGLSVRKSRKGACLISEADGGRSHHAVVAPGIDPVLMICYALCVDFCTSEA